MFVHVKLINRASLKNRPQYSDTKWSILLYDFLGFKYLDKKDTKTSLMSLPGTTGMPSAGFPCRAILCITLCLSPIPLSVAGCAVIVLPFLAQPAFADPLDTMKAREFLQKGNNHLNRYEFQQALDAYTECLLCDPSNRNARENIVLTHNNWGIWWFQKRKYKEAREEWEQALKLNPADRNARQNLQVLRVTLSRAGVSEDGEKKPPPQKANSDFPPSQVIILTPGLKQGSGSTSSGAAIITGGSSSGGAAASVGAGVEAGSGSTGSSSGAALMGSAGSGSDASGDTSSGAAIIIKSSKTAPATTSGGDTSAGSISTYTNGGNANPYSTGATGSSTPSAGSGTPYSTESTAGKFTTAPTVTPTPPAPSPSTATAGGSQGENIEDMIGQIEQKIYGRKQDSLPIMKRLEKLETDTHGKTKSGTIKERIDTLRKSYGF